MKQEKLYNKFMIKDTLKPYAELIMEEMDWEMVRAADDKERMIYKENYPAEILDREYKRGVLNKKEIDGEIVYCLGTFMRRIDCCMRGERQYWNTLPEDAKKAYVEYMQSYDEWVLPYIRNNTLRKSHIVPVEIVIDHIKSTNNPIYLQECDCRIYSGNKCKRPVDTCLHWPDSILNTSLDRGFAKEITKEEAVQNIRRSDQAGLVHSFSENGVCNCCTCCCWGLKGLHHLEENGFSAKEDMYDVQYVITLEEEKCVNCGLCVTKCQFQALKKGKKHVEINLDMCYGCGVCRVACKKNALVIRKIDEMQGN